MSIDYILSRRSIRKYTDKPIKYKDIEDILKAAMSAPSARNLQPWEFIVISDQDILEQIPSIQPYTKMVKKAPLAFVVCGNTKISEDYWVQDCSAATQNMLLAINAKGLGAVWCGIYPKEERYIKLQELLKLPKHIIPLNVIPVGYPAEEKESHTKYDKEKIHRNKW